ncbi:uncharacterized protein UTRI_10188 [Ustilago trichophora]|uniref:Effector family protein Eff1 n=1 Tax=Ustilago trichophora TaxID=86804 RepID=A0A5C3EBU4_9BASI|nr:uncharacterized protein UTRI_10188 [Ustilago trichophora]
MRLFTKLSCGLALAFITALIGPRGCESAGSEDRAGPSSSTGLARASPERSATTNSPPKAYQYINHLDPERIDSLSPFVLKRPKRPFHEGMPIFNTKTDVDEVEQALQDYGSVGIVDPKDRIGFQIDFDFEHRHLGQRLLPNLDKALLLERLPGEVHILAKHFELHPASFKHPISLPAYEDIKHLSLYDGAPIISADSGPNLLSHMVSAAYTKPYAFWYAQDGLPPVLIRPRQAGLARVAQKPESDEITRILTGYKATREKYGEELASILRGHPIPLEGKFQNLRKKRLEPMVLLPGSGRDKLVDALQEHGRFQFDTPGPHGITSYIVEVRNPDAPDKTPMHLEIKPLSRAEEVGESLLSGVARAHPHF